MVRHYSRAIWTCFVDFGCLNKKFVYLRVEEKSQFFMNYDKWSQQFRNFHFEAQEHLRYYGFQRFVSGPYQGARNFLCTQAAVATGSRT